jgi:NADH-quinone oxidoreductase subunit L
MWSAWLCIVLPLIGVVVTPLLARINATVRDYGAVFFSFLTALAALRLIPYLFDPSTLPVESAVVWLRYPMEVTFGVLVDPLSIILANVVAVISFFIMVYSLGYMKGDQSATRYWMLMNLFIGSMLLLVLANNLLFLFVGWKMVGLCSYGLIGYYYHDEEKHWIGGPHPTAYCTPSHAGLKALVTTSAGDVLLLGGILIVFSFSGTFNLLELYRTSSEWIPDIARFPGIIIVISLLLLAGPAGKSAQFPFHEWLPEAMAGPTPVSALIHAATMVKSGVYLVARLIPIFYYAYWVVGCSEASLFFLLTALIGGVTALLAATQALVSLELKKVLAYSTVSQIGYMWLGLGAAGLTPTLLVGGFTAGIFHLVSHALFKVCLFLCAGSVLHAAHTIYMHEMGGLKKSMPLTWIFMSIAALSLMGIPPLPGFWSKDAVLLSTLTTQNYFIVIPAFVTVILTAFYSIRFIGMTFHGAKSGSKGHGKPKKAHGGDGYPSMWLTCGILACAIVLIGIFGPKLEHLLRQGFEYMLVEKQHLPISGGVHHASYHLIVPLVSIAFVLIGAIPAYYVYISRRGDLRSIVAQWAPLRLFHRFFWNRWYIDKFYYRVFVNGTIRVSDDVPTYIEDPLDATYHRAIPTFPKIIYDRLKVLRTENRQLFYNVAYILIFLILFFILIIGRIQ